MAVLDIEILVHSSSDSLSFAGFIHLAVVLKDAIFGFCDAEAWIHNQFAGGHESSNVQWPQFSEAILGCL